MKKITLKNIDKSFGETTVLRDFSADFILGENYYINGVSGKGKTTLIRILCGLEKVDNGEILGLDKVKLSVVFQEDRLIENLSALKNISIACSKNDDEILSYLNKFGLLGFEKCKVSTLSGGMKRRVSILRALMSDFDVLILDEALKGLDLNLKSLVISEILSLTKEKTIIFTTHTQDEVDMMQISNIINL